MRRQCNNVVITDFQLGVIIEKLEGGDTLIDACGSASRRGRLRRMRTASPLVDSAVSQALEVGHARKIRQVVYHIQLGKTIHEACKVARISYTTLALWRRSSPTINRMVSQAKEGARK